MGIDGIHILHEVETMNATKRDQVAYEKLLIKAHGRGEHANGHTISECPSCKAGA